MNTTDKEVKAVLEVPVVKKDDIGINAYGEAVELMADYQQKNATKQRLRSQHASTECWV